MDYFIIHQDERIILDIAKPKPESLYLQVLTREEMQAIPRTIAINLQESGQNQYIDYIEKPIKLVSEKLKQIMSKYQSDIIFKTAVLLEKKKNRQEIYYLLSVPQIDCASTETVYDMYGNVREFVLDEKKTGQSRIFSVSGYGTRIIVRLDVAESILRRSSYGIVFEKVKTA